MEERGRREPQGCGSPPLLAPPSSFSNPGARGADAGTSLGKGEQHLAYYLRCQKDVGPALDTEDQFVWQVWCGIQSGCGCAMCDCVHLVILIS